MGWLPTRRIRRATRRQFSAEEKIRIVLSGLRGEDSIAELCRREGSLRTGICGRPASTGAGAASPRDSISQAASTLRAASTM